MIAYSKHTVTPPNLNFLLLAGVLRKEIKMTTYWRGLPKVIHSTISLPNHNKPDGYDYYAFSYSKLKLMQVTIYLKRLRDGERKKPMYLRAFQSMRLPLGILQD